MQKSLFWSLALVLLMFSCSDPAPKKTYTVYEFGQMDTSKIRASANKIHSITASAQGVIYVAGQKDDNTVVIDRTKDGLSFEALDLTTGKTPDGTKTLAFDTRKPKAQITVTGSLHDGVIVYEPVSEISAVLEDSSTEAKLAWTIGDANFIDIPRFFTEWKLDEKYYLISTLDKGKDGFTAFERGQLTNEWIDEFKRTDAYELDKFTAITTTAKGEILLAREDGFIFSIDADSFQKKRVANKGNAVVLGEALDHRDIQNSQITSMLMVGKYLLVGFKAGNINQGGLFFKDISSGLPITSTEQWANTGSGLSITGMVMDRNNPDRAIISTSMGVMIFENGQIKHLTKFTLDSEANKGSLEGKPKNGVSGTLASDVMYGVAQGSDGKFYFLTSDGVATMEIKSKEF